MLYLVRNKTKCRISNTRICECDLDVAILLVDLGKVVKRSYEAIEIQFVSQIRSVMAFG
jgi:hypothetical protein